MGRVILAAARPITRCPGKLSPGETGRPPQRKFESSLVGSCISPERRPSPEEPPPAPGRPDGVSRKTSLLLVWPSNSVTTWCSGCPGPGTGPFRQPRHRVLGRGWAIPTVIHRRRFPGETAHGSPGSGWGTARACAIPRHSLMAQDERVPAGVSRAQPCEAQWRRGATDQVGSVGSRPRRRWRAR